MLSVASREHSVSKQKATKVILTIIVAIIAIAFMFFPFLFMVSASFKTMMALETEPLKLISSEMTTRNYETVFSLNNPPFFTYYFNSVKIAAICVIAELVTSTMSGFAFAKLEFKGKNMLFLLYLATMMIPFQAIMVPQFMLFQNFNIYNTHLALILPRLCTVFGTFMMRQYFMGVPNELIEAAKIDGAGEYRTFLKIMLPIAKPIIATLGIIVFVWRWNEYEAPLIFLSKRELYTLPLAMVNFVDDMGQTQDVLVIAAGVCALLPMVIVFLLGQKYLISGITSGSVKG